MSCLGRVRHVSRYFWKRRFFPPFSKYTCPHVQRSVFESFSTVHTKLLKRWKYAITFLTGRLFHARRIWCMTSSYSKTSVFVRPHVNGKPLLNGAFLKRCVFPLGPFSPRRVDGRPDSRKNLRFQPRRIRVNGALESAKSVLCCFHA